MAEVYVIQVMAHHGYGLEGWRTVRKAGGAPYGFRSFSAAHAAPAGNTFPPCARA